MRTITFSFVRNSTNLNAQTKQIFFSVNEFLWLASHEYHAIQKYMIKYWEIPMSLGFFFLLYRTQRLHWRIQRRQTCIVNYLCKWTCNLHSYKTFWTESLRGYKPYSSINIFKIHSHRPKAIVTVHKRSWGKVIFSEARVKNSVHGGQGCLPIACWDTPPDQRQTPPPGSRHPPGSRPPPRADTPATAQCMLRDTSNKRAVRILLECILVIDVFWPILRSFCDYHLICFGFPPTFA